MQSIPCQATHLEGEGCYNCSGYKVVLHQRSCPGCHKQYWARPNSGCTVYDGKPWTSFDGLELVWRHGGVMCKACDEMFHGKP
jgi:hypothetical protein